MKKDYLPVNIVDILAKRNNKIHYVFTKYRN